MSESANMHLCWHSVPIGPDLIALTLLELKMEDGASWGCKPATLVTCEAWSSYEQH